MVESKLESLFVIPPGDNRKTFKEDEKLPSLPLPELEHTLERYLDSVKALVTPEEYRETGRIVKEFSTGIGKILHEKLREKANKKRNWVEKWWLEEAYLKVRTPLIPYCSMDGVQPKQVPGMTFGSEHDQIRHASIYGHFLIKYWLMLRKETLKPTETADKKTLSMFQFRRLYNTVRVPGEKSDRLVCYFKTVEEGACPSTVIILCRGRIFRIDGVDENGEAWTPPELEKCFWKITEMCKGDYDRRVAGVSVLTCDNRTNWSKNRNHLKRISKKNEEILRAIEESMFVLVLDDDAPDTDSDVTDHNICGDYNNRWADKSSVMIFYKNGRSGGICDHTAFDGIATVSCQYFGVTAFGEIAGIWKGKPKNRKPPNPLEIEFDLDDEIKIEMKRITKEVLENKNEVLMTRHTFDDYGKPEIQKYRLHPDTFVQMALQLAYVKLHGRPAPCYETATTRGFYNGRTETLRACTPECVAWVNSMLDPKFTAMERRVLLEKAVKRHDSLMNEARENAGCDRHLFGLYCTALEEGIEIPRLYSDTSYFKSGGGGNFVLSTSCVGYTSVGGGVAPMCTDGYGIFYNILSDKIQATISVNTHSNETNAFRYFDSIKWAFRQMRLVLLDSTKIPSKL